MSGSAKIDVEAFEIDVPGVCRSQVDGTISSVDAEYSAPAGYVGSQNEMRCLSECREGHCLSGMGVGSAAYQTLAIHCRPGGARYARFR